MYCTFLANDYLHTSHTYHRPFTFTNYHLQFVQLQTKTVNRFSVNKL